MVNFGSRLSPVSWANPTFKKPHHFDPALQISGLLSGPHLKNGPYRMELEVLSREKDPELFLAGLLNLGNRLLTAEKWEAAAQVFAILRTSESAVPLGNKPIEAFYGEKASRQLEAIQGKGAVGPRVEFLVRNFSSQALDLAGILGMGLAGAAFRLARFSMLKGLLNSRVANILTRGVGARGLANLAGVLSEATVLSLSTQAAQVFSGQKGDHGLGQFGNQFLQNGLGLVALRLAGWSSGKFTAKVSSPRLDPSLGAIFHQGAMLGGILFAKKAGEKLQLTEASTIQTSILDGLVTLLHFHVGARLSSQLFGKNLGHWQKYLDIQTGLLSKPGRGQLLLGFQGAYTPAGVPKGPKVGGKDPAPIVSQVSLMAGKSGKGGVTPAMEKIIKSLRRPDDYPLEGLPDFIKNNPDAGSVGGKGGVDRRTPSSRRERFWQAVKQDPENMELRQVYGDLLLEEGDPRGALIALSFRGPLTKRQEALQRKLQTKFVEELCRRLHQRHVTRSYKFEGGFLKEALFKNPYIDTIRSLLSDEEEPFIRELVLRSPVDLLKNSREIPELRKVKKLTIQGLGAYPYYHALFEAMAASPHFSALNYLEFQSSHLRAEDIRVLANSPHLSNVRHLILDNNSIGLEGAEALFASPYLTNLTHLSVESDRIGLAGLRVLAGSAGISKLSHLSFFYVQIGDEEVRSLAASPGLSNLTHLNLYEPNPFDDSALRALIDSPYLKHLSKLMVNYREIDVQSLRQKAKRGL